MGGVSNNYNLDINKLQQQQGSSKTVSRNAFQKDSRLSMNGSVFAGKIGGSTSTSNSSGTGGLTNSKKIEASDAKKMASSSKAESSTASVDMDVFAQDTANYQRISQQDVKDSANIQKSLTKEQKNLAKVQKNYTKATQQELKLQKQNAEQIEQANMQMTQLQSNLQNAVSMQSASGATGFMGDGTSDINAMTAELESLGGTVTGLQQNTQSSVASTKSQYKTMSKSSKNVQKLAAKYTKVTTTTIARNTANMAATDAGTSKAQKITKAGGIISNVGSSVTAIGTVMMAIPTTAAAGAVVVKAGAGISVAGGVMTTIGTKGQDNGAAAAASLTQAAAALSTTMGSTKATTKSANATAKSTNALNKQVETQINVNTKQADALRQGLDEAKTTASNAQSNPSGGSGVSVAANSNQSVASTGAQQAGGLTATVSNNASVAANSGMTNPIASGGNSNTGAPAQAAPGSFASSTKAAMSEYKNSMGGFGRTESQNNGVENPSNGSSFASGNVQKKEEELV